MSAKTGIEWTDATWNPIRGCSRVSAGCQHCYAELVAARFSGPGQPYEGLARRRSNGEPQWTGTIAFVEKHLTDPLRWRKPRRVFVNSMSDLFHEGVTDEQLDQIFAVMALAPRHQFQVLTKRPERMRAYLNGELRADGEAVGDAIWFAGLKIVTHLFEGRRRDELHDGPLYQHSERPVWPLPNVWLGVSVEHQAAADERIPLLLQTPAAVRFLSCEPLLGYVDLLQFKPWIAHLGAVAIECEHGHDACPICDRGIDWVIVGGESGPGARACSLDWILKIVRQCQAAFVPVFVKQLGSQPTSLPIHCSPSGDQLADRKGGDPSEWPDYVRVRQFPAGPDADIAQQFAAPGAP